MGVMYDYFSADSDELAAATIDVPGGPAGSGPAPPMPVREIIRRHGREALSELMKPRVRLAETGLHVVATKGFDATSDLGMIEEFLSGIPYDTILARPRTSHVLAERHDGENLVLTISDELRQVLAASSATELSAAAERFIEWNGRGNAWAPADLLIELSALARGAIERGEHLYCWVCV